MAGFMVKDLAFIQEGGSTTYSINSGLDVSGSANAWTRNVSARVPANPNRCHADILHIKDLLWG